MSFGHELARYTKNSTFSITSYSFGLLDHQDEEGSYSFGLLDHQDEEGTYNFGLFDFDPSWR
jgi:hypothetical protein